MAVVVDHYGWLGVARQPVTVARVAGIALLAAGVFLVVRS
jgi:transporter family-2 protein